MNKRNKIIYWVATGLMCLMMLGNALSYFIVFEEASTLFESMGYPARMVIPLGILKILAVIAIVSNQSPILREWAYVGLLIDFLLALEGHLAVRDGQHPFAIAALSLWVISYVYGKRISDE